MDDPLKALTVYRRSSAFFWHRFRHLFRKLQAAQKVVERV
jgi:hypothetical protein